MDRARALAHAFRPIRFDAAEWLRLAVVSGSALALMLAGQPVPLP